MKKEEKIAVEVRAETVKWKAETPAEDRGVSTWLSLALNLRVADGTQHAVADGAVLRRDLIQAGSLALAAGEEIDATLDHPVYGNLDEILTVATQAATEGVDGFGISGFPVSSADESWDLCQMQLADSVDTYIRGLEGIAKWLEQTQLQLMTVVGAAIAGAWMIDPVEVRTT